MNTPGPGALIVVEGLDRAGKTTQVERLVANLKRAGYAAERIKFPDRTTPIGQTIDAYLTAASPGPALPDHAIHLLFSANRWEAMPRIMALIEAGTTVVVDRYAFSGAVYSAAKGRPSLDLTWAWAPEIGLPAPDVVLYLEVSAETQEQRGGWGAERYEGREMQDRVRSLFETVWAEGFPVRRIDASGTMDRVEGEIWARVKDVIESEDRVSLRLFLGPLSPADSV